MKLLIYDWTSITKYDLYNSLEQQGIQYDLFSSHFSPRIKAQKENFIEELESVTKNKSYDAFFSTNYFPEMAEIAKRKDILYISWTYDSPSLGPYNNILRYETNRIFCFDSIEYNQYKENGLKNIYYLPLAVNSRRMDAIKVPPLTRMKYYSEVSFVGQLYNSEIDKIYPLFDEYSAGYISGVINTQLNIYGKNIIDGLINDNIAKRIINEEVERALINNLSKKFYPDIKDLKTSNLKGFLQKTVTYKERVLLLKLLAKYFRVNLYSNDPIEIQNVHNLGTVDYVREMPYVFKNSKINLNTTLKLIKAGIPQRVLDIMGCRGLVLTNYQRDMEEYFSDGENILIYRSAEEALEKCRYYLKNEGEAERIKEKGYEVVKNVFNYEYQFNKIWDICGLKNRI